MFNDNAGDFNEEFNVYFDALIRPFKKKVLLLLKDQDIPVKIIAPATGRSIVLILDNMSRIQDLATTAKPHDGRS